MNKLVAITAALTFLSLGSPIASAADSSTSVTCNDHTKQHGGKDACAHHGGVQKPKTTATPIDTTKGFTPDNKATSASSKSNASHASSTAQKKTNSNATSYPTARCNDGAQYFSKK